jgi:uncharacterized protein
LTYYIDTSVLVAYYCPEVLSEKAELFLREHSRPVISLLCEVEFFSALSRKIREGNLGRKDCSKISTRFLSHANAGYYDYRTVEEHHYRLARDLIGSLNTSLRTLDALHLALVSSDALTVVTADEGLFKSAETLGIDAVFLNYP